MPRFSLTLCASALALGVLHAAAHAAPVRFIAGATAQTDADPPGNNNFIFNADIGQQTSASALAQISLAPGPGVPGSLSQRGQSQADLASGTLRVASEQVHGVNSPGGIALATAFFGDGYDHFAGDQPFSWSGSTTARFDIRVTGSTFLSSPNIAPLFNSGLAFLTILPRGTMDDFVPFCGAFQSYFWSVGPSSLPAPCGGYLGNLDGSAVDQSLSVTFNHPGDFDWVFGMRVGGAMGSNGSQGGIWRNDFFSTAVVTYTPPEGVTALRSESGTLLAGGAPPTAVPEPATLALLSMGLLGLAAMRRRRVTVR